MQDIRISPPRMESPTKTAKIVGMPVHWVRQKFAEGEIVGVRAGRCILINVDKLLEYLNTHTEQPKEDESGVHGIKPISAR